MLTPRQSANAARDVLARFSCTTGNTHGLPSFLLRKRGSLALLLVSFVSAAAGQGETYFSACSLPAAIARAPSQWPTPPSVHLANRSSAAYAKETRSFFSLFCAAPFSERVKVAGVGATKESLREREGGRRERARAKEKAADSGKEIACRTERE